MCIVSALAVQENKGKQQQEAQRMQCSFCGSERVIQTESGYRCRNAGCEGFKVTMQSAILCDDCQETMEYRGLNSWGEPSYKCTECGMIKKL